MISGNKNNVSGGILIMKKDLLKGILIGGLLTVTVAVSAPVAASGFNAQFNLFRVKKSSGTIVDWGKDYLKTNRSSVPATIYYKNEAYISMELLQSVFGSHVMWNGDSSTVTLSDHWSNTNVLAMNTRRDANGNTWRYSVINDYSRPNVYLLIEDDTRGFSRAYDIAGVNGYEFTTDGIYIAKVDRFTSGPITESLVLTKILYGSNQDNQDGDDITIAVRTDNEGFGDVLISGGKICFVHNNYKTGEISIKAADCYNTAWQKNLAQFSMGYYNITFNQLYDGYLYYTAQGINYHNGTWQYKVRVDGTEAPILLN